jgi:mechanosensitive ion channel-like protein
MWHQAKLALDESATKFLTGLARLLPGLVALVAALLISIFLAWILAKIVRWILSGFHFDEKVTRWGFASLADWSPLNSPTRLVSRTMAGLIIIAGVLIGLAAVDVESAMLLVQSIFAYIPNILGAILVLFIGTIVARFLARSVLIGAVNMNFQYARLLSMGVKWLVIVLTIAMALEHLRIGPGIVQLAFGILFGGIVLTLALSVGLNSKELVAKSLDRETRSNSSETIEEPFHHL